jgi:hypothetical protein
MKGRVSVGAYDIFDELKNGGWQQLSQWRVDAKSEGLHLDFKHANWTGTDVSDDDRKNLSKGLSGFGNIAGGVLVYGADCAKDPTTKLDVLSALPGVTPLDRYTERLASFVKASSDPPVPGVIVHPIPSGTQPNHGVVIVYIPLTDAGPFRALSQKPDVGDKYFMRTTSDMLVMPHQILAASFGRRPPPRLRVGIEQCDPLDGTKPIRVHVMNTGRGAAQGTFVRLKVLPGQNPDSIRPFGSWVDRGRDVQGSGWDIAFAHPSDELLFPGESRLAGAYRQSAQERKITVRVDCANGLPVEVTRTVELQPGGAIEWFESDMP